MSEKVIALSGDYGYINQISTTIKSILYHIDNCKIYVVNTDIPQEWFDIVNQKINSFGSVIIDKKLVKKVLVKNTLVWIILSQLPMGK